MVVAHVWRTLGCCPGSGKLGAVPQHLLWCTGKPNERCRWDTEDFPPSRGHPDHPSFPGKP